MNESDIGWLLQTIEDPETAERFVAAQYHRGRLSYQVMTDISRERGWISRPANEGFITEIRNSAVYATAIICA